MTTNNLSSSTGVNIKDHENYLEKGNDLCNQGKWGEALPFYQKAIELEPDNWLVYHSLGDALLSLADYHNSIKAYRKCIELNSNFSWTYYNLGLALLKTDSLEESIQCYAQVDQIDPNFWNLSQVDFKIQHEIGDILFVQQRWAEAELFYNRAICLNASFFWSHYNLGRVLYKLKKFEDAITSLNQAIDITPNIGEAHYTLGKILSEIGKINQASFSYQEALKHLRKQVQQDPSDVESYRMILAIEPNNPLNWSGLIHSLICLGKVYEATLIYQDKIKLLKEDSQVYIHRYMGDVLIQQGRVDQAVLAYTHALEKEPYNYSIHYNLGLALSMQGRLEEATVKYYDAIDLNPDDSLIYQHLGNTLARQGKIDEATKAYHRVLELEAREVDPIKTSQLNSKYDEVNLDQDEIEQKIHELHQAIYAKTTPETSLYEEIGNLYIKIGNIKEAFKSYYYGLS